MRGWETPCRENENTSEINGKCRKLREIREHKHRKSGREKGPLRERDSLLLSSRTELQRISVKPKTAGLAVNRSSSQEMKNVEESIEERGEQGGRSAPAQLLRTLDGGGRSRSERAQCAALAPRGAGLLLRSVSSKKGVSSPNTKARHPPPHTTRRTSPRCSCSAELPTHPRGSAQKSVRPPNAAAHVAGFCSGVRRSAKEVVVVSFVQRGWGIFTCRSFEHPLVTWALQHCVPVLLPLQVPHRSFYFSSYCNRDFGRVEYNRSVPTRWFCNRIIEFCPIPSARRGVLLRVASSAKFLYAEQEFFHEWNFCFLLSDFLAICFLSEWTKVITKESDTA